MDEKPEAISKTQNYVVARYRDGKMIKGITYDFGPQKRSQRHQADQNLEGSLWRLKSNCLPH